MLLITDDGRFRFAWYITMFWNCNHKQDEVPVVLCAAVLVEHVHKLVVKPQMRPERDGILMLVYYILTPGTRRVTLLKPASFFTCKPVLHECITNIFMIMGP